MSDRILLRWVVGVALAALIGYPLLRLVEVAVAEGIDRSLALISDPVTLAALANTLLVGLAVTLLAVTLGTVAAFVTERAAIAGRNALRIGMLVPLVVPLPALGWARAYGPGGMTDTLLGVSVPGLFGPLGVIAVITSEAVPLAYLVIAVSLATRQDPDLERAARVAGASALEAFRSVSLPLLRPALLAAGALSFITAVNAFAVPAILGMPGGFPVLTTRIYRLFALSADPASFAGAVSLALALAAVALAAVLAAEAVLGPRRSTAASAPRTRLAPGRRRWLPIGLWGYLAITVVVPLTGLVLVSLTRAVGLPPVPSNWTLDHYAAALGAGAIGPFANSLVLAVITAMAAVLLGGLLAVLRRGSIDARLGSVVVAGFAVPGTALAVAILLAYGAWLRDSLLLIGIAYLAKLWALGHRPLAGALDAIPAEAVAAARASGATRRTALRTVAIPLIAPAAAAAGLLVFLFSLQELTISILLYGPQTATLAVVILNLQQLGDVTTTSALTVLLSCLLLIAALPLVWLGRQVHPLARR